MTACELHINFDLQALAEEMISDLQADWTKPFEAPVLLFSDRKVEQWFRIFFLKSQGGKNAALINLQSLATEQFLFSMLAEPGVQKLSTEMLCDLLVAKLAAPDEKGQPYFLSLGSDEVTAYLTKDTGKAGGCVIDEIHLYDFAEQMAALLIDYETTRPANFSPSQQEGLLTAWRSGKDFFGASSQEAWQRKLYQDFLAKPLIIGESRYATLGSVFQQRLQQPEKGKIFSCSLTTPVYLFGFSGMGQLHRTILQAFAQEHPLKVYLQGERDSASGEVAAAASAPSKASAAGLLESWGQFGKENIRWWKSWASLAPTREPLTANDCERLTAIASRTHITEAASKIREIEYLHSKICSLLMQQVIQSDILVLAPDISAYRTAILEVFDQHEYSQQSDFPSLPYRILDLSARTSHVCQAVHTLLSIIEQGTISRPDFFALVRSPFVQRVRGIRQEMVDTWLSWTEAMNLYRRHNGRDDWAESVRRLLLSRITNLPVLAQNETTIIPYSDFDTGNRETLEKFVACITDLEDCINLIQECKASSRGSESVHLSASALDALKAAFDRWLLYSDNDDSSFANEQVVYRHVSQEFSRQASLFDAREQGIESLSLKGVTLALKAASLAAQGTSSQAFTGGITFASFQPNRILPAKYVFILGLDSKSFPGLDRKNTLDLRNQAEPWLCDNAVAAKNRYSFLCQLMATQKELYLSYVTGDLQKDEPFYPSSLLLELERFGKELPDAAIARRDRLTVDETRPWEELFTSRAFRNKANYQKLNEPAKAGKGAAKAAGQPESASGKTALQSASASNSPSETLQTAAPIDRVTIGQLVKFLTDPFQFRVNNLFSRDSNEDAAEERQAFEPIELSPLAQSQLLDAYLQALLEAKKQGQPLSMESARDFLDPTFSEAALYQTGFLPEKNPFGKKALENMQLAVGNLICQLEALAINPQSLVCRGNAELALSSSRWQWTLSGRLQPYWESMKGITLLTVLRNKRPDDAPDRAYLASYLSALVLVAQKAQESPQQEYAVNLAVCNTGWTTARSLSAACLGFALTPADAVKVLQELYEAAFITKECDCLPFKLLFQGADKAPESLYALKEKLTGSFDDGIWKYFAHKNLFDPLRDIGYRPDDFKEQWQLAAERQKKRCLFL